MGQCDSQKEKRITGSEFGQEKRSTSLLATRTEGVKKQCIAHSVKCLRRLRRTAKVFVSYNLCKRPHTFTAQLREMTTKEALL